MEESTLFGESTTRPLADRMRPSDISEIVGQEELLGEGAPLRRMIDSGKLSSFILWGPPGCGHGCSLWMAGPMRLLRGPHACPGHPAMASSSCAWLL